MKRENLVKKLGKSLGKKVLPCVMACSLLYSIFSNYGCGDDYVKPDPKNPVAMLSADPTSGETPLNVRLDGSLSYVREPGTSIVKYHWDVNGDDVIDLTTLEAYIDYIYENAGEYNASLIVEDSQGRISDKALENIVVTEDIVSLGKIAFWSTLDAGTGEIYLI